MNLRSLVCLILCSSSALAAVRPFTIDTVLEDLRKTHPHATRVVDETPAGVTAREDIVYTRNAAGEFALDIYRPAASAPRPAVLIVHGGGWLTGDRRMERPFAKQLAARGYVTVPVSYRLGREGRFPAPLHDLKAAVRWLRAHATDHGIDPARIALIGGSSGASLATFVGATNGLVEFEGTGGFPAESSTVQAVVNIDGSVSFADNALIQSSETKPENPYWEYVHGPFRENRATWIAASALLYTGPRSAPVLFIKSTVTQPILCGRDEMSARLKILGLPSAVITYPDTPHPFWLVHPWFERVLDDADAFLRVQLAAPH